MTKINLDKIHSSRENLDEFDIKTPDQIPFKLLKKPFNRTTKLLANSSEDQPTKGANRRFEYQFIEPVFLMDIIVSAENYPSFAKYKFGWALADGTENSIIMDQDSSGYRANINQLVTKVYFLPPAVWFRNPMIHEVRLTGFETKDLGDFLDNISGLEDRKIDILDDCDKAIKLAESSQRTLEDSSSRLGQLKKDAKETSESITNLGNELGSVEIQDFQTV